MRWTPTTSALTGLAIATSAATASAQQPSVAYPRGYTYYQPTTPGYPSAPGYYVTRPVDNRGVLPSFATRGGVGTTPYLGNTRGLGAFSTNYDASPRSTYPARRGWPFRRYR